MIKFEFIPEDQEFYDGVKIEIDSSDEASIYEHFEMFKKFLYSMGFFYIEEYKIVKINKENCGEILTEESIKGMTLASKRMDNPEGE